MKKIKVVVIDDALVMRAMLRKIIEQQPDMTVIGTASDPIMAREIIRATSPDVLTLDVEMPRMDGLDFLERLMRLRPTPVLMISSLTGHGSEIALRALELGAVDVILKPATVSDHNADTKKAMESYASEVVDKIRAAAQIQSRSVLRHQTIGLKGGTMRPMLNNQLVSSGRILVFGASTGGTEALKDVLINMPGDAPGIVIAQHMPEGFTKSFSQRMDTLCSIHVKEAEHGDVIQSGHAYIAPGHSHLLIGKQGAKFICELSQSEPVNRHRPSVDVLFHSAAKILGSQAIGVILTGMGKDGAIGMKAMHDAGAYTFAQDEASCVVFGMPREAIAQGGVDEIVALDEMTDRILAHLRKPVAKIRRTETQTR